MRLFVALALPTVARRQVGRAQEACRRCGVADDTVRWTPPGNAHLTLRFLGEVDDPASLAAALEQAVEGHSALRLRTDGVRALHASKIDPFGMHPREEAPTGMRLLYLALAGELDALASLQASVEAAVGAFGPAAPRFFPHITLGRVRRRASPAERRAVYEALRPHRDPYSYRVPGLADVDFEGATVALVRSVLGAGGARYDDVVTLSLSPRPGPGN